MEVVQILMSTYNGETYLKKQLDSIVNQTYSNIRVLIRDDGSSDNTIGILKQYAKEYKYISYYQGKNIGAVQSFFDLLKKSDDDAEYYSFADQDDEWMPQKVERAIEILREKGTRQPLLYCGDTYITDSELNIIKKDDKKPRPSWGNALVQNICTGCTAVINRSLRDIVKQTRPEHIVMHDWWLYLTAELFGQVCYDDEAYIKYRQHGNNAYGMKKSRWDVWKYRIRQLGAKRGYLYPQLREVLKWYPKIKNEQRALLMKVLAAETGWRSKVRLAGDMKIYRNSRTDDLVYRGIVLIGKL